MSRDPQPAPPRPEQRESDRDETRDESREPEHDQVNERAEAEPEPEPERAEPAHEPVNERAEAVPEPEPERAEPAHEPVNERAEAEPDPEIELAEPVESADVIDDPHVLDSQPEPVDATADAGADEVPVDDAIEVEVPDAAQPEYEFDDGVINTDPAEVVRENVEQQIDGTPDARDPDVGGVGGAPSAPTNGPGSDFDADDPFDQDLETDLPDLTGLNDDPFSLDVDAPAPGTPDNGDGDGWGGQYELTKFDDGSFMINTSSGDIEYDVLVKDNGDGTVTVEPLGGDSEPVVHQKSDIEVLYDVDLGGADGPPAEAPAEAPQTEMDRLEMHVRDAVDWVFGSGDTTDDDPAGDYAPDSVVVAPGEVDFSDPNFQHQVSERDGAITWGDHDAGLDGSRTEEYDGVDYGEEYTEADIPVAEATDMLVGNPLDQPDVDPERADDGMLDVG